MPDPESTSDPTASANLTVLLQRMRTGDPRACEKAIALVYGELHRIAANAIQKERPGHLLQTTALIHEAYLRLTGSPELEIESRAHFFAIASQQMRRILIDFARARDAKRRGSGQPNLSLDEIGLGFMPRGIDLLLLDESLQNLQKAHPRAAQVVEMKFFGGYTDQQVVESLGASLATIRRDWDFARAWLFDRMKTPGQNAAPR